MVFLLNAAWQVTFVALVAAAIDRLLLRTASARNRHLLWVAALTVSLALPFATPLRIQPAAVAPASPAVRTPASTPALGMSTDPAPASAPVNAASREFKIPTLSFGRTTAEIVLVLYSLLLLFRLGGLAAAWNRTRVILRQAREVELPPAVRRALDRCREAMGTGEVRVLASELPVPLTLGTLRPAVILPSQVMEQADTDVVTSAVGHELAHIARRDYLFNLVYEISSLPLWFHPALALVLRRIRETREVRCDELVTERLQDARVYAQSLVELAGAALPFGRAAATITVGIADADILEERVKNLLNRPRLKSQTLLMTAAALLFAVPCVAAARLALHVNVQPLMSAATQDPAQGQMDARRDFVEKQQDFIHQHQVGDIVSGKVVKVTNTRAVLEVAPGVNWVIRVPQVSSSPYELGSVHDLQVVRVDGNAVTLRDPSATYVEPGNVQGGVVGGVASGVVGGVQSGVVGGVPGTVRVRTSTGENMVTVSPEVGYAFTQEQNSDPRVREKLDMAKRKAAETMYLVDGEPATPEARAKLAALKKEMAARETAQLMQDARAAKITMEQAISIAQSHQMGTVFETRLAHERGVASYIVGIVSGDENNPTRTRFLINATDGTVMDTFHSTPNNNE